MGQSLLLNFEGRSEEGTGLAVTWVRTSLAISVFRSLCFAHPPYIPTLPHSMYLGSRCLGVLPALQQAELFTLSTNSPIRQEIR